MSEFISESLPVDTDGENDEWMFNSGELNLIAGLEAELGPEAARLGGDIILELRKVEEEHGRS